MPDKWAEGEVFEAVTGGPSFGQGLLRKCSSEKCHQVKNFPDLPWPISLGQPILERLDTMISEEMARPGRRGQHGKRGMSAKMVMVLGLQQAQ